MNKTSLPIGSQISGLYEGHLPVADLTRARAFYQGILGLELARELPERRVCFLWVGAPEVSMLGLWESGSAPMGMRLHFAFRMGEAALHALPQKLRRAGVQPLGFHGEPVE
ncbi:glyoxalase family protein [Roseobacter sp. SK209-2-6]|uniref:VOC family protein n=1 Tax=Roseobacter sp. SK209-2-6 TaxID=388739 RepID=UPI0000F3FD71|nr:VOC family protein [Roseobacter sp. SK209-2-6]EBA14320.1 glyoxalase family protein [Roseobacter sp. SK209-2-6]